MEKQKVLIPLDGSELSAQILPVVQRTLTPERATLVLMRAVAAPEVATMPVVTAGQLLSAYIPPVGVDVTSFAPDESYFYRERGLLQHHSDELEQIAQPFRRAGYGVEIVVEVGDPVEKIREVIATYAVDLIAMATHGRTGLRRILMGSVAEALLHGVQKPILLLRPQEG